LSRSIRFGPWVGWLVALRSFAPCMGAQDLRDSLSQGIEVEGLAGRPSPACGNRGRGRFFAAPGPLLA
jgi:hypothetical protein